MFSQFICTSIRKFVFLWNFNIQWSKYNQGVFKNIMYSKGQRRCVIFSYSFSVLKYNVLKHIFFFRWVQIKWGGVKRIFQFARVWIRGIFSVILQCKFRKYEFFISFWPPAPLDPCTWNNVQCTCISYPGNFLIKVFFSICLVTRMSDYDYESRSKLRSLKKLTVYKMLICKVMESFEFSVLCPSL